MQEKYLKDGKKNMEYSIKLADQFLDEFEEICDYISNKLKNIDASNRLRENSLCSTYILWWKKLFRWWLIIENKQEFRLEFNKLNSRRFLINLLICCIES